MPPRLTTVPRPLYNPRDRPAPRRTPVHHTHIHVSVHTHSRGDIGTAVPGRFVLRTAARSEDPRGRDVAPPPYPRTASVRGQQTFLGNKSESDRRRLCRPEGICPSYSPLPLPRAKQPSKRSKTNARALLPIKLY